MFPLKNKYLLCKTRTEYVEIKDILISSGFQNQANKKVLMFFGGEQEIYRPGPAISHAANLCTAVGGDQNKEFRGKASFLREKGQGVE